MKKRLFFRMFAGLLALMLAFPVPGLAAANESGDGETEVPAQPTDFSVSLSQQNMTLAMDETYREQAQLTVEPEGASLDSVTWEWESSDTSILDIELSGDGTALYTPQGIGRATVTVTAQATVNGSPQIRTAQQSVTVTPVAADSVLIVPEAGVVLEPTGEGSQQTLRASVTPSGADPTNVEWSIADSRVAAVSPSAGESVTVSAVAPGRTTITASSGGVSSQPVDVEVSGLVLNETSIELRVGQSTQLAASGRYGSAAGTAIVQWESSASGTASVDNSGRVTAQRVGSAQITATVNGYSATCTVEVVENTANVIRGSAEAGQPFSFSDIVSDINSRCQDMLGTSLSFVTNLSVLPAQGILYYGYVSSDDPGYGVGSVDRYYRSPGSGQSGLSDVVFVPASDFSGTATISYSGYNASNQFFTGTISISVSGSADVSYTVTAGQPVRLSASDFSTVCQRRIGRELSYVTFEIPTASRGVLYYNYSSAGSYSELVTAQASYYLSRSPYLDNITFVPAEDYSGTLRIGYRAVDTSGSSYSGRMTIVVTERTETGSGDVRYTVDRRDSVDFRASDFSTACREATGGTLDYVRFTLPSDSDGTLYYNYRSNGTYDSRVDSGRYYRSGSPSISNISFVPGTDAAGSVTIRFTGYNTRGGSFDGRVVIQIEGDDAPSEVRYNAVAGRAVDFSAADFNEVCLNDNGEPLDYITFDLPSSNEGTLYYNYSSSSSTGTRVRSTTRYYRSGSPSISNISFVPRSGSSGNVYIDFSGYDTEGGRFDGSVRIEVTASSTADTVRYSVASGRAVLFNASDFDIVSRSVTGEALNYVRFTLPAASRGVLYYQYDQDKTSNTRVSASTNYYRTGGTRLLDDVSFVADSGYSGTVTIAYTGRSTGGEQFEGTVEITVTAPQAPVIRYSGSTQPIAFSLSDFESASRSATGRNLSHVQFTSLPASSMGRLYVGYEGPAAQGTRVTTGSYYYVSGAPQLSQVSFVPHAEAQGTVTVNFTGTDTGGETFTGRIEITLTSAAGSTVFTDMGSYAWAGPSVDFLYSQGVVSGVGGSQFGPGQAILRGDFVLMLCRAFDFEGSSTASGFYDVPAGSYYAQAITTARSLGIVTGDGTGRFRPTAALTRQDAMVMLQRAMNAAGISAGGSESDLTAFSDAAQVSAYARSAVAALVRLGVVQGDEAGRLNPGSNITRAEMAVILHRVLTL